MATQAPKAPSYVFGYLPQKSSTTPPSRSESPDSSPPSLFTSTTDFLGAFTNALKPSPRVSIEEERSLVLRQVKAGLEAQMDSQANVGIAAGPQEKERMTKVDEALRNLATEVAAAKR